MSQFLLLLYAEESAWESLSEEEQQKIFQEYELFSQRHSEVIRGGAELHPTQSATSIRSDGKGGHLLTDGAFAETKEALGGYFLVEVETLDNALALAKELPLWSSAGVEVRPTIDDES